MGSEAQVRWAAIKEEYFEATISGKGMTFREIADKYNLKPQTIRNRSSVENWPAQIESLRASREQLLGEKMAERTNLALDQLNQEFATNEVEIRKRHALIARGLQVRAVKRLRELDLSAFGPRDALLMLKMGLEEERKALGLPDISVGGISDPSIHPEYKSVSQQIGGHKKVQAVGMMLLKALRDQADTIIDVGLEDDEA